MSNRETSRQHSSGRGRRSSAVQRAGHCPWSLVWLWPPTDGWMMMVRDGTEQLQLLLRRYLGGAQVTREAPPRGAPAV